MAISLDKNHLIAYGLAIALALGLVYTVEARIADRAESRATAAEAKAQLIAQQNTQFQAQVSAQITQLQAANDSLAKALASRQQVEVNIPPQNGSLSAAQVSQAIETASNSKPGTVTSQGDTITLPLPLGQLALSDMQLVPLLQADKVDLQKQVSNGEQQLSLEKSAHKSDVDSDRTTLAACQADVKAVKAKARKNMFIHIGEGIGIGAAIVFHFMR